MIPLIALSCAGFLLFLSLQSKLLSHAAYADWSAQLQNPTAALAAKHAIGLESVLIVLMIVAPLSHLGIALALLVSVAGALGARLVGGADQTCACFGSLSLNGTIRPARAFLASSAVCVVALLAVDVLGIQAGASPVTATVAWACCAFGSATLAIRLHRTATSRSGAGRPGQREISPLDAGRFFSALSGTHKRPVLMIFKQDGCAACADLEEPFARFANTFGDSARYFSWSGGEVVSLTKTHERLREEEICDRPLCEIFGIRVFPTAVLALGDAPGLYSIFDTPSGIRTALGVLVR